MLNLLDNYLRLRIADGRKIALIIDFAETIAPAGDVSGLAAEDRNALVTLKRWAQHPSFLSADITICLIAENLAELNAGLVQNPGVAAIAIPLPDEDERLEFIRAAGPLPGRGRSHAGDAGQTHRGFEARADAEPDQPGGGESAADHDEVSHRGARRS